MPQQGSAFAPIQSEGASTSDTSSNGSDRKRKLVSPSENLEKSPKKDPSSETDHSDAEKLENPSRPSSSDSPQADSPQANVNASKFHIATHCKYKFISSISISTENSNKAVKTVKL